mgnify:CR=1 FL=1
MSSEDRYIPDPAVTSDIHLPEDLMALGEDLAKNVHEVWAAGRIADGWPRGPRNDDLKQHPCLVPYEKLSEEEKDYDRRTSVETLKFILSKGYDIVKK